MWFCCLLLYKRSMTKASAWQHVFQTIDNTSTSKGGMLMSRRRGLVQRVLFIIVRLLRDGWIENNEAGLQPTKDFARRPAGIPSEADLLGAHLHFFERSFHPVHRPPLTMSAALKNDIKSAMSGVGVALSGDMLSKCEFRGLRLYFRPKYSNQNLAQFTGPGGRPAPATHLGTGEERWPS